MSTVAPALMTMEELLALPEDGMSRELIQGQLRETPMTMRNQRHAGTEPLITHALVDWLRTQPAPRGKIFSGEAGFRLRTNPDSFVGIDAAYVSAAQLAATPKNSAYLQGPPILAVEILSPSEKWEDTVEKVKEYLDAGVALVWLVDPSFRTVQVHRPGAEPETFNVLQELTGDPHLPGFRIAVASIFD